MIFLKFENYTSVGQFVYWKKSDFFQKAGICTLINIFTPLQSSVFKVNLSKVKVASTPCFITSYLAPVKFSQKVWVPIPMFPKSVGAMAPTAPTLTRALC